MGYRNYLHVCQHCGVVHATASSTPPTRCVVCEGLTFSEHEPESRFGERHGIEGAPAAIPPRG
jgi:hypothetical protein